MIVVQLTPTSSFWHHDRVVDVTYSPETYAASPFFLYKRRIDGELEFTVDLSRVLDEPLPYDVIFGKTVNEIRALIGGEDGYAPLTLTVTANHRFTLPGTELAETIIGNSRINSLDDGQDDGPAPNGQDQLYGGGGNDSYDIYSNQTQVFEYRIAADGTVTTEDAGGRDRVDVRFGDYVLPEFVEGLSLSNGTMATGNASDNSIYTRGAGSQSVFGLDGDDELITFAGNDRVDGGRGNDILAGYSGNDVLIGGEGGDLFFFDRNQSGRDMIVDFDGQDVLVTRNRINDSNGDGVVTFSGNARLDLGRGASVSITDADGAAVTALEYDGSFVYQDTTLYVYSLVGSAAGVATAQTFELSNILANYG